MRAFILALLLLVGPAASEPIDSDNMQISRSLVLRMHERNRELFEANVTAAEYIDKLEKQVRSLKAHLGCS